MCHVTLIVVESREAHVPREQLPCMSFIEAKVSIPGHSSVPSISHISLLVRQVLTQLHQLCCCLLQAAFPVSLLSYTRPHSRHFPTHQTSWCTRTLSYTLSAHVATSHGRLPPLFQPTLILNTWPGTSYVTSYPTPPMMCHFCQFPGIFHLLLPTIFSHGKSSLCCTDIRGGHPPSLVMSQVTIRSYCLRNVPQLIAIVIQSILNVSPTSAVPQLKGGRGFSPILGDPHCTPLQNHFSLDSISTISAKKVLIKITIYLQIVKSTCHFHILILLAL